MSAPSRVTCGQNKGRFCRKRKTRFLDTAQEISFQNKGRKMRSIEETRSEPQSTDENITSIPSGRRIIEYKELGKSLLCNKCGQIMSLLNIEHEKQIGLAYSLKVRCSGCKFVSDVHTCKSTYNHSFHDQHDINCKLALSMIDSGMGAHSVNTFLSGLNIAPVSTKILKRYERRIGPVVEEVAKESCQESIRLERDLTIASR